MNKTIFILSIGVSIFVSCNRFGSKQQKAERLVKVYLDSTLNDSHSYESVSFSKVDTLWGGYTETAEGKSVLMNENLENEAIKQIQIQQEMLLDAKNWDQIAYEENKTESELYDEIDEK